MDDTITVSVLTRDMHATLTYPAAIPTTHSADKHHL